MKRLTVLLLALALVAGACSDPNEDADELRSFVRASEREPRTYTINVASENQAFRIHATVEDELRYAMVLSFGGREVMDYVVRDDALGLRLRDPSFAARLANVLGDPVVDAALKEGRWVTDPAGAPPLIRSEVDAAGATPNDPFREAQDILRFVIQSMGQSPLIREFTLDNVEYRSRLDPWRYPNEERGEVRYDLRRPILPKNEAQTIQSAGDIGPEQFRKMSVFVSDRRIRQICSFVDVQGHEEFIELRRRGLESNRFLAQLLQRIEEGETAVPIEERYVVAQLRYPRSTSVDIPPDAATGKLETFLTAFEGGLTAGILNPAGRVDTSTCRRTEDETEA